MRQRWLLHEKNSGTDELSETLDRLLDEKIFQCISDLREKRLLSYRKVLGNLPDISSRDEESMNQVSECINRLREEARADVLSSLGGIFFGGVESVASELPEVVIVKQGVERFQSADRDSIWIQLLKAGKSFIWSAGRRKTNFVNRLRRFVRRPAADYPEWTQRIPLRSAVKYQLLKKIDLPTAWIDQDKRLLLNIIIRMEKYLGATEDGERSTGSRNASDVLKNQLKETLDHLDDQLDQDRLKLVKELMQEIETVDTLERSAKFYSEPRLASAEKEARNALERRLKQWEDVTGQMVEKAGLVEEFWVFSKTVGDIKQEFICSLGEQFHSYFLDPLNNLRELMQTELDKLNEVYAQKSDQWSEQVRDGKTKLGAVLQKQESLLAEARDQRVLTAHAEQFVEKLIYEANEVQEKAPFIFNIETDRTPPVLRKKEIEWRLLVVRRLKDLLLNPLQPSTRHYEEFTARQLQELTEVKEVLEVNFSSALELENQEGEDDPLKISIEALKRTLKKIEDCTGDIRNEIAEIEQLAEEGGRQFVTSMLGLLHSGDAAELQVLDAKYRVREKTSSWKTKFKARWARGQDRFWALTRLAGRKAGKYVEAASTFIGYGKPQIAEIKKADIATYLLDTDSKIRQLPYIYRRLFDFDTVTDRRFYIPLNENFAYLKKSYDSWSNGFPATFAVIGEKGSGKSTYLQFALGDILNSKKTATIMLEEARWTEEHFIALMREELNLENVQTVDEIIDAILSQKKYETIVIECLQNLYLRTLRGYGAIELFLYVMSETKDHVFWIVSCSSYTWNFLKQTQSINEYFTHIARSDMLDKDKIEAVILNRHRTSGYELWFEPGDVLSKSRTYRKLLDREEKAQEYLREKYFRDLANISEGNASIAMIFWIRSIHEFDETHLTINPLEITSVNMIEDLNPNVLFTLAALILHDSLSAFELSQILNMNNQESRLMLTRLKTKGLLQEKDDLYMINHLMFRQVVRVLKERNIIHLV